jgi:integrase
MNCRKCQKPIPDGALFCPWCGVELNPKPRTRKPRTRPNGAGSAYRRGKTWTAQVVVAYRPSGDEEHPRKKAVYRTKGGFKTKREALDYCVILKQGNYKPKASVPKLVEYWDTYSAGELQKLSKSKQCAYNGAWKKLSALQYRPVDQITVAELRDVVAKAATTYYTVKDCKAVLMRLFELAGADGWASKDLPSYIVMPALEEKEREPFTDGEQAALWKLYESGDLRAAIPLLMICTGMMPGEAQKLRVDHIDLEALEIYGAGLKTKVRRKSPIIIPEDVLPIVQDLIDNAQPSGFIWKRVESEWYADYYAALEKAGCRRLEPYSCRHTTATRLAISEGIAPQTIKRMMRWSTSKMLDRYAHPDQAAVHTAANTIKKVSPGENCK